jgi:hypothetical protein
MGGVLADRVFQRSFRVMLIVVLALASILLVVFGQASPHPIVPAYALDVSPTVLVILVSVIGAVFGAVYPALYELSVELTYPLPEIYSGGLFTFLANLLGIFVLIINSVVHSSAAAAVVVISTAVCALGILPMRDSYKRSVEDVEGDAII